jgi:hypothetical protein
MNGCPTKSLLEAQSIPPSLLIKTREGNSLKSIALQPLGPLPEQQGEIAFVNQIGKAPAQKNRALTGRALILPGWS